MCVSDWLLIIVIGMVLSMVIATAAVNAVWWLEDTSEAWKRRRYYRSLTFAEDELARCLANQLAVQEGRPEEIRLRVVNLTAE